MKRQRFALLLPSLWILASAPVGADELFILTNGGQVVGELLNPKEVPRKTYQIKTQRGTVTLARSQVKETLHRPALEAEYERVRPRYADTVEGQWALVEWCRKNGLVTLSEVHLERIIELDPDHEQARKALGYFRRDGEWKTRAQLKEEDGYVWYKGKYRLPQEIQLMKEKKSVEAAEGDWMKKLRLWRGWLFTPKYHQRATEAIRQIDDPYAVKALASALESDSRDRARVLYIEALAQIGDLAANVALAEWSLRDPVEEVRLTCLDYLKPKKDPQVVKHYIGKLREKDRRQINRAALALQHMGDPSAIGPLIGVLITAHKYKVGGGNPGQMSMSFPTGGSGGTGMAFGGAPKIFTRYHRNQAVLDALVSLSGGVSYGFNVAQWRAWYAAQKRHPNVDTRRD